MLGSSLPGGHAFVRLFPICATFLSDVVQCSHDNIANGISKTTGRCAATDKQLRQAMWMELKSGTLYKTNLKRLTD